MNWMASSVHPIRMVTDHEKIDNCIETIKDYAEDSLPVLTDSGKLILGILICPGYCGSRRR